MIIRRLESKPRGAVIGAGLCIALAMAACGGGSPAGGTRIAAGGPKGSPLQVLGAAATATVGTAHMDMKVGADFSGLPGQADENLTLSGSGAFDLDRKAAQFTVDLGQLDGGKNIEMIAVGNTVYLNTSQLGLSGVKPWITLPASSTSNGWDYTQFAQTAFDGAKLLSQLKQVTVVGNETVKGVVTTHYRGQLDLAQALTALGSSGGGLNQLGAAGGSIQSILASTSVPMNVWIDGQDRMRRFTMSMDLGPVINAVIGAFGSLSPSSTTTTPLKAAINVDYTLYDFGAPVSISAPPPDQVGTAPPNFSLPGSTASPT